MSILYLALLIPLFITGIFYFLKPREFAWWEFFIPIAATLIAIIVSHVIIETSSIYFTEYWGSTITAVYEEEPYNYWHHQTCSYTTSDGKGHSTTHYYDCSHQVDEGPEWYAVTNLNEKINISEKLHDKLVAQFGTHKTIINSRHNYSPRDKCSGSRGTKFEGKRVGEISYVYQTSWSGSDDTREAYTSRHSYINKIKATDLSIFNMTVVNKKQADSLGLFNYPEYNTGINYPTILGGNVSSEVQEKFKRLNGKFGVSNQLRLWILVFENKPMSIVDYQKNYWVGGNMNELVICIGKRCDEIMWSRAFSWSLSDELTSAVQNEVLNLYTYRDSVVKKPALAVFPVTHKIQNKILGKVGKNLPAHILPIPIQSKTDTTIKIKSNSPVLNEVTWNDYYNYLNQNLNRFKRRTFKEFDYLDVEPSTTAIIIVYILALIVSVGVNIWVITNSIHNDDNN